MSIKFITDSASDMCEKDGVTVVPMTITFGNDEYKDGVTLSHREFYEKLIESDELPRTSQVSPYDFETSIGEAVADGSEVIVVTMASGLSGTYQSAVMAADKFDGVYVVDSESVTIGEIILIKYGMQLAKDGCSAAEIVEKLNECKKKIHSSVRYLGISEERRKNFQNSCFCRRTAVNQAGCDHSGRRSAGDR